ncbi:hypothetical protein KAT51_08235, partial [bacterium]|nr:hypothetical protein [bacterium]
MNITEIIPRKAEVGLINLAASTSLLRPTAAKLLEQIAYHLAMKMNVNSYPQGIQLDKFNILKAMIHSSETGLSRGLIGSGARNKLAEVFLGKIVHKSSEARRLFIEKHGMKPPGFVLVSPTSHCNLKCKGCYAGSD